MSTTPESLYRSAMQKLALGEREGAIRLLKRAVSEAPGEPRYKLALDAALAARAKAMSTEMAAASAEELLAEALKLKETEELKKAARAIRRRRWGEAEGLLSASLADRDEQPEKQVLLALVRARGQGDPQAALAPARRAVVLAPRRQDALYLLEEICLALEKPDDAQRARVQAWEAAGEDPQKRKEARKTLHRFIADPNADPDVDEFEPDTDEAPRPVITTVSVAAVARLNKARLAGLSLVMLLAGGLVAADQLSRLPTSLDPAPYAATMPVARAAEYAPGEVVLQVDPIDWDKLTHDQQLLRLHGVMKIAETKGYSSVYIHTTQDRLLGSIRDGRVYLPKIGAL